MKVVTTIDAVPEINALCKEIEAIEDQLEEKMMFIKKQANNALERAKKDRAPYWLELKKILVHQGLLKEETNNLSFSREHNAIFYHEDGDSKMYTTQDLMRILFDRND